MACWVLRLKLLSFSHTCRNFWNELRNEPPRSKPKIHILTQPKSNLFICRGKSYFLHLATGMRSAAVSVWALLLHCAVRCLLSHGIFYARARRQPPRCCRPLACSHNSKAVGGCRPSERLVGCRETMCNTNACGSESAFSAQPLLHQQLHAFPVPSLPKCKRA